MGEWLELEATDGQKLSAYLVQPQAAIKGGLVVLQEIFGVNAYIQSIANAYAQDGYLVIAPALFDRIEPGVQLTYSDADMQRAFSLYGRLDPETALLDVAAAFEQVEGEGNGAAVLGFCYGGFMAWLSATRGKAAGIDPKCAVGYYAGGIDKVAEEKPTCPVMLHFGASDSHVGADQVGAVREAHPEVQVFIYEGAEHAFDRDVDPKSFSPNAATLGRQRTLAFLQAHLG